jgi:hypothetical protein
LDRGEEWNLICPSCVRYMWADPVELAWERDAEGRYIIPDDLPSFFGPLMAPWLTPLLCLDKPDEEEYIGQMPLVNDDDWDVESQGDL